MTYIAKPKFHHPNLPRNELGLTRRDYEGAMSTLCAGCGHDSVTAAIIEACYELNLPAHMVAKMSGIGCSSKTPTYFLTKSHGFNSVHGRMPSVATGANLANNQLKYIGVSGDGDTASIGFGQFAHAVRRQVDMLYVVENNGTYGLTKGQFSATNDRISIGRKGQTNAFESIDLVAIAIQLGASFVARGFSGDKDQLVPLIKAALSHKGFAFIDVISPCVTFNNHGGSTKSFEFVRDHEHTVTGADYVPHRDEITADYKEGAVIDVTLHDESRVRLRKLDATYDPSDRAAALQFMMDHQTRNEVVTGLLYLDTGDTELKEKMDMTSAPLNSFGTAELRPDMATLEKLNMSLR
jgi:2-oxoglutarate/2-oxoacid ferredoxin oxidoreductase subunit beta